MDGRIAPVPRCGGEPAPDLTTHRVLHRAMCRDLRLLVGVTAQMARGGVSPERGAAVCDYVTRLVDAIRVHQDGEDRVVWPLVTAVAVRVGVDVAGLARLADQHEPLATELASARSLAGGLAAAVHDRAGAAALSRSLRRLAELSNRHVADEERLAFPLCSRLRAGDYQRAQQCTRAAVPELLPFLVPWVAHHARPDELPRMLAEASWGMHAVLRIFDGRFAAHRRLVFGLACGADLG